MGDEDQSIYSWRGADIRNILEFEKDFPNARIVRLEQNYRSTQIILEAAGAVVANNVRRKGKKLWTERQGGSPDRLLRSAGRRKRGAVHCRPHSEISARRPKPARKTDESSHCAVLYRTNSQSRLVEEALRRYNISYTMVGGFSFYERAEIKDMLGYLRLVRNPHDSMALQRVINTPARGIGKTTLETLERLALETGQSTWDALGAAIAQPADPHAGADGARVVPPAHPRCAGHDGPGLCRQALRRRRRRTTTPTPDFGFGAGCSRDAERDAGKCKDSLKPQRSSISAAAKTRFRCSIPRTSRRSPRSRSAAVSADAEAASPGAPGPRLETWDGCESERPSRCPKKSRKASGRPAMRPRCPS